ncbi:hypothetical protein Tco_1488378, partial [Tanacetum coccineum]
GVRVEGEGDEWRGSGGDGEVRHWCGSGGDGVAAMVRMEVRGGGVEAVGRSWVAGVSRRRWCGAGK